MVNIVAAPTAQPMPLSSTVRREGPSFEPVFIERPFFSTLLIASLAEIVLAVFAANQLPSPRLVLAVSRAR